MGYTLRIGELEVEYHQDDDEPRIGLSAKGVHHDDAPAFGEPTDGENQRWPSYTAWSGFAEFTGLYPLFFGKEKDAQYNDRDDGLIASHPGCVPLTERHRQEINAALEVHKAKYPKAVPTYGKPAPEGTHAMVWVDEENPEENWQMTRLVWLHYWVNWALDNCKQPVFENT